MAYVYVREIFELLHHHNPISGHCWTTHGRTTGYEIVGPSGVIQRCRTAKRAEALRAEWDDYYQRHGLPAGMAG